MSASAKDDWLNHYENTDAIIFVVDAASQKLFEEAANTLKDVLSNGNHGN